MSELTNAYEEYHNDPSQESADKLSEQIKSYDFATFDEDLQKLQELAESNPLFEPSVHTLVDVNNKTDVTNVGLLGFNLTTNGSTTGKLTTYAFDENYNYWREGVTAHLRNPEAVPTEINLEEIKTGSIISAIEEAEGPVWLSGRPVDFIFPTTDPKLADYIRANADKIKYLTSYDTEPLMRRSIYHNDQMIDWMSGLNFRTCRFGNKHILPTFAFLEGNKVRNMLNLCSQPVEASDLFDMKGFFKCPCGATACNLDFIPHVRKAIRNQNGEPFYMPELMNSLKGSYMNLQFLQEEPGGKVLVYVVPNKVPQADYDYIRDLLSGMGLDSELKMNRYFVVGRKLIHFWQAKRENVKELNSKVMI
jgi:hypothetical protein